MHPALVQIYQRLARLVPSLPAALLPSLVEALVLQCAGVQQPEKHLGHWGALPELALEQAANALTDDSYIRATAAVVAMLQQAFLDGLPLPAAQPNMVLAQPPVPAALAAGQAAPAVAAVMPASERQAMQDALITHCDQLLKLAPSAAASAAAAEATAAALREHVPLQAAAACSMPGAAADWVAAGGLLRLHAAALLQPAEMLRAPQGVALHISRSVDFGLQQLGITQRVLPGDGKGAPAYDRIRPLHGMLFREVTIKNRGQRPVWLLNVCLTPQYEQSLSAVDDHGICFAPAELQLLLARQQSSGGPTNSLSNGTAPGTGIAGARAALLRAGQEYRVTVLLDTSGPSAKGQETGLLQQFLMMTVLVEGDIKEAAASAAANTYAAMLAGGNAHAKTTTSTTTNNASNTTSGTTPSTSNNASTSKAAISGASTDPGLVPPGAGRPAMRAVVLARCVTAALLDTAAVGAVQRLLSAEARPFVPQQLRSLFDAPPQAFYGSPGSRLLPLWGQDVGGRVTPQVLGLPFRRTNELPGNAAMHLAGAVALRRCTYLSTTFGHELGKWPFVQSLVRLLCLEELAMERDIVNSYALYNVRLRTAVFTAEATDNSMASRRYCIQELPVQPGDSRWQEGQPALRYRGPSLSVVRELMRKKHPWRLGAAPMLAVLQVPGLSEQRPDLRLGDAVYVRPAAVPGVEYAGHVLATDGTSCLVMMAEEWWQHLQLEHKLQGGNQAPLVHVRFTFDRTAMHRMCEALLRLPYCQRLLLPPEYLGGPKRPVSDALAPPNMAAAIQQTSATMQHCGTTPLNPEQRIAVATLLHGGGKGLPLLVFGPPGTGKTITLVEAVCQELLHRPNSKVLCCAPQNYSADLICCALAKSSIGLQPGQMLRLNDTRRPIYEAKQESLPFCLINEAVSLFRRPTQAEAASARVIICTCSTAGILPTMLASSRCSFDFVCVDEAGQAVVPEALIPLTLASPISSILLCGDPKQLSPVVRCPIAALHGLATSLLELLVNYHSANAGQLAAAAAEACAAAGAGAGATAGTAGGAAAGKQSAQAKLPVLINQEFTMLVRNYRSHSRLLELPSRLFYGGQLLASANPAAVAAPSWHHLAPHTGDGGTADGTAHGTANQLVFGSLGEHGEYAGTAAEGAADSNGDESGEGSVLPVNMLFFGVRGEQRREGDAPSYFNAIEAVTLVDLVQSLLEQPPTGGRQAVTMNDIGVIATYRKQVQKIRMLLRERGLGAVRVGTVDDYQGQEERIVFISTVLSKPESLPPALNAAAPSSAAGAGPWAAQAAADGGTARPELHLGLWNNPRRFNVAITRAKALLVVVGSPMVLMKDANWRELLRHAAARGAYRGAGLSLMQRLYRSDADVAGMEPFGIAQLAADAGQLALGGDEEGSEATAAELAAAVRQIAELAQLGMGDVDKMYPETLDEYYESCADELQWRVAL